MARAVNDTQALRTVLSNGIILVSETLPGRQQVSLSITIAQGSRHQQATDNGFAHLLEHMFFKGSRSYTGEEINRQIELLGGGINAFTDRETTVLHGTVLAEDGRRAFALLSDMLLYPQWTARDLYAERGVVAQEAAMVAEDLEDWLNERAIGRFWSDSPLAWPVLGRATCIRRATAARLRQYHAAMLAAAPIVVTAVGAISHDTLRDWARPLEALPQRRKLPTVQPQPSYLRGVSRRSEAQQAHALWLTEAAAFAAPEHLPELLANLILGGGSASRLFRHLRDRLGLAYQVYSQVEALSDTGEWSIYCAVPPAAWALARREVLRILRELADGGPTPEEFQWARHSLRVQWLLGQGDLEIRMARLTRQALYLGRCLSEAETLDALADIREDQIRAAFGRWQRHLEWSCQPAMFQPRKPSFQRRSAAKVATDSAAVSG
ncbi:MAG: M16 family metallopeptidase [Acidithiobacillus sp.]|uniref:M16 family metallopeptidase n=1 Tax=Acidithiobacillus sp. TaxID=1872118 RepID=UPI003D032CB4